MPRNTRTALIRASRARAYAARARAKGMEGTALAALLAGGGGSGSEGTPRRYRDLAREAVVRNIIGHRAVKWVAETVAALPIVWRAGDTELEAGHPLIDFLERPNLLQTREELIEELVIYLLLGGRVGLLAENLGEGRVPVEAWAVRPDRIDSRTVSGNPVPLAWVVQQEAGTRVFPVDPITGRCDLLVLRRPHPLEPVAGGGLSDVEPAAWAIDQMNAGSAWNYSLLRRGARPIGGFSTKEFLEDTEYTRLRDQLDEQIGGPDGAGRPLLLEGDMQWVDVGRSPVEMDWLRGHEAAARETAVSFGVPPQVLGIPGSQTFANYKEARMAGYEDTVIPLGNRLVAWLERWLTPAFGDGISGEVDRDNVDALLPKRVDRWNMIKGADDLTPNERREALGYEPVEGGDEVYVQPNKVPLWYLSADPEAMLPQANGDQEGGDEEGGNPDGDAGGGDPSAAVQEALARLADGEDRAAVVDDVARALGVDAAVVDALLADAGAKAAPTPPPEFPRVITDGRSRGRA